MLKTCLKCGHPNHEATGAELEPCPSCGAIYSRVESAWGIGAQPGRAARPASPAQAEAPLPPQWRGAALENDSLETFAARLRATSMYPTFRQLVGLLYVVMLFFAGVAFVGGALLAWRLDGAQSFGAFVTGLLGGLFWLIVARVSRETSLMLADLADAAVRIASRVRP